MKVHQLVKEWLSEYKSGNDDYSEFHTKFFGNTKFYAKLSSAIETKTEIEPICHQIYNLAYMENPILNQMVLDFLPIILETYLIASCTVMNVRESDNGLLSIRSCLLSVYNLLQSKLVDDPDSKTPFFIPTFTDGSIFHSQVGRPDLDFLNYSVTVSQPKTTITDHRQLTAGLIRIYNQFICNYSHTSLDNFCSLASRLASLTHQPRIDTSSDTLHELLTGVYFILANKSHNGLATRALRAIEARADFEMLPSVVMAANAIDNSFKAREGPIGLEALSGENVITYASFKPKKISEDLEHLLDVNRNNASNNTNRPIKSPESIAHGNHKSVDSHHKHHGIELADIQFKLTTASSTSKCKNSPMVKCENRLVDTDSLL